MPPVIRPATPQDLFSIVALLTQDAQERSALDPPLWIIAVDAPARIEKAVGAGLRQPQASARELWFVAEDAGRVVGVTLQLAELAVALVAMRVVAEHTRATIFCIADGVLPGRIGRDYVLRYIMRRAIRYGRRPARCHRGRVDNGRGVTSDRILPGRGTFAVSL